MKIERFNISYKYNNLLSDLNKYYENDVFNTNKLYMEHPFWKDYIRDVIISHENDNYTKININDSTIFLNTYILNKNKSHYDLLEKFVFETAKFNLNNINKSIDDENIIVEFWFSQEKYNYKINHNFHFDNSETDQAIDKKVVLPILTTVSYFNNYITTPTMITNMHRTKISDSKEFFFSFPIENTQVVFLGSEYLHGPCFTKKNIYDEPEKRYILNIQIFDQPVSKRILYKNDFNEIFDRNNNIFNFTNATNIKKITKKSSILTKIYNQINTNNHQNKSQLDKDDYRFIRNNKDNRLTFSTFSKIFNEENISYSDIINLKIDEDSS